MFCFCICGTCYFYRPVAIAREACADGMQVLPCSAETRIMADTLVHSPVESALYLATHAWALMMNEPVAAEGAGAEAVFGTTE